jgi:hypothetical protein
MRPLDTTPEAHAAQLAVYRRMSTGQKLELACELCDLGREQMIHGILARNPRLSRQDAWREMLLQLLGVELYAAAFGSKTERRA